MAVAACAAVVWALPIGSTYGQPRTVHLKLARGTLRVSAPAATAVVGRSVAVTITVTDARGTGAGWVLKLSAASAVRVSRVAVSCTARSSCTPPAASGIGTAPVVLRARPHSGMGVMRFVVTLAPLKSGPAVPVKFLVTT